VKSPWKSFGKLEPDHEYVVLASSIPPRSRSSTWRLFNGARAVSKQMASTRGVVGFSLLARPLQKQYVTLSVWVDEGALAAFVESSPHHELMAGLSPEMGETRFLRWMINGSQGRPSWDDALQRLGDPARAS
jgi:heme-degrading monooxygenase HmoA